jgi:hypothetical protein
MSARTAFTQIYLAARELLRMLVCWSFWCVGHSGVLVILVCWSFWCVGHFGVLVILVCWSFWCVGRAGDFLQLAS